MNKLEISKKISFALRHKPENFGLELDSDGYVDVNEFITKLNNIGHAGLTMDILKDIVDTDDKGRYKINDGMICACYGHSIDNIKKKEIVPPDVLYHGTSPENWKLIQKSMLKHMGRKYVHSSTDLDFAKLAAMRKTDTPIYLKIDAKLAYSNGIKFYEGNEGTCLSDDIPVQYIKLKDDYEE